MISLQLTENINISFKQIFLYIVLFASILIMGKFIKDGIGILSFIWFFWLLINKKYEILTYFLIIWLYLNNYFIGQQYINKEGLYNVFFNGKFYILILFLSTFKKKWLNNKLTKVLSLWVMLMILISLISGILHFTFRIGFITEAGTIMFFIVLINLGINQKMEKNVLALLISIGLFEVIISYLQMFQVLPPPVKQMANGVSYYEWIAGLDDVASGTFGAAASNVTSWFETTLFLFFFSIGVFRKKKLIILLAFSFILQYGSVDSKTALGVTLFSSLVLLLYNKQFSFFKIKSFIIVGVVILIGLLLSNLLSFYYNTNFKKGTMGVQNQLLTSIDIVINNFADWGKIAGFKYISEDWINNGDFSNFFLGYGKGNFEFNNNSGKIELMDTLPMSLNNFTRSRSAFIKIYGNYGLSGLLMLLWLFFILWRNTKSINFKTNIGQSFQSSGKAFIAGSMLFMFLYGGHTYKDLAFQAFLILYAMIIRIESKYLLISRPYNTLQKSDKWLS